VKYFSFSLLPLNYKHFIVINIIRVQWSNNYTITVFWWGKCVDLLTFEKNDIHWARKGELNIIFFKSQLIHTLTESKDSNCFILYFEEIVVFWNKKKLHVHCPDVVLHYCLHHHAIIWILCGLIDFWKKWYSIRPFGLSEYHFFQKSINPHIYLIKRQ
jgi:hypothetical protein